MENEAENMISDSRQPTNVQTDHQYLRDFFEHSPVTGHLQFALQNVNSPDDLS